MMSLLTLTKMHNNKYYLFFCFEQSLFPFTLLREKKERSEKKSSFQFIDKSQGVRSVDLTIRPCQNVNTANITTQDSYVMSLV